MLFRTENARSTPTNPLINVAAILTNTTCVHQDRSHILVLYKDVGVLAGHVAVGRDSALEVRGTSPTKASEGM